MTNALLLHYVKLTEFLGKVLGPAYEVVLHDLTDWDHSVIAIANNRVSGREVGAPLPDTARKSLMDKSGETQAYRLHDSAVSAGGKALRSSTFYIKQNNETVGMLCINFDDSGYQAVSEEILRLCHPDAFVNVNFQLDEDRVREIHPAFPLAESVHNSIDAAVSDAVNRELTRLGVTADRLTPEERVQIIASLESGGTFLLKGAVRDAADALGCSQASVYRYLSQLKKDE